MSRVPCRCGWLYVPLAGGYVPVRPDARTLERVCPHSLEATAEGKPRSREASVAHLRAVAPTMDAMAEGSVGPTAETVAARVYAVAFSAYGELLERGASAGWS